MRLKLVLLAAVGLVGCSGFPLSNYLEPCEEQCQKAYAEHAIGIRGIEDGTVSCICDHKEYR